MVWEMVKVASTIALMAAAPKLVRDLSWPAMLVGLILALKVYWLALAFNPRPKRTET
jgi:ATP synthase protein I